MYVGVTLRDLDRLVDAGELGPAPVEAYAVTGPLTAALTTTNAPDPEELEFAATEDAARASLGAIAGAGGEPRRVVVAAEVDDAVVRPDPARGDSAVVLDSAVALRTVRAVHIDDAEAVPAVTAAVRTIDPDRIADGPEEDVLDALAEHQLLWYASQEIAQLAGKD